MAKVLLVEDDNNLREIYQARLMAEGYDIVAAQNGEEALVVAKQNKPDLIISDVMMPRISGFEMLDILRNTDELKHTRVIMLTALGQAEDQKRASGLGADKYLVKSQVTLEDIVNAAKELLGEDGAVTDTPPAPAMPDPIAMPDPATPPTPPVAPTPAYAIPAPDPAAIVAVDPAPEPATPPVAPAIPVAVPPTTPEAAPEQPVATPPEPAVASAITPTPVATPAPAPIVVTPPPVLPAPELAIPPTPPAPEPTATTAPTLTPPAEPTAAATVGAAVVPVVEPPVVAPVATPVISMPVTESTSNAQATSAVAAVSDAATQTLEAEEAALQSQIDNYASTPAEAPLAVEPAEVKADESNAQTITSAVEQLNTPTEAAPLQPPSVTNALAATAIPAPDPATPPVAPAIPVAVPPATPEAAPEPAPVPTAASDDNRMAVAGRKVIQPISDPATKPDLNALLAKEEAAEPAPPATPMVNGAPAAPTPTEPAHLPGQAFDPNKAL